MSLSHACLLILFGCTIFGPSTWLHAGHLHLTDQEDQTESPQTLSSVFVIVLFGWLFGRSIGACRRSRPPGALSTRKRLNQADPYATGTSDERARKQNKTLAPCFLVLGWIKAIPRYYGHSIALRFFEHFRLPWDTPNPRPLNCSPITIPKMPGVQNEETRTAFFYGKYFVAQSPLRRSQTDICIGTLVNESPIATPGISTAPGELTCMIGLDGAPGVLLSVLRQQGPA